MLCGHPHREDSTICGRSHAPWGRVHITAQYRPVPTHGVGGWVGGGINIHMIVQLPNP
jgi:hypothetical protein